MVRAANDQMAKKFKLDVPKQVRGRKLQEEFLNTAQTILKEQTVLRLYKEKKISTGTAAKMLGMPLHDFMRFAAQHRVSVFPEYTSKQLDAELCAGRRAVQSTRKNVPVR